jgi:hypothetical protein
MFHANAYVVTSAASAASGITVPQSPPLPLQILEGPLLGEMPASDGAWRFTGATRSPTAAAAAAGEKEEDIPDSEGAGFFAAGAGTPLRGGLCGIIRRPPLIPSGGAFAAGACFRMTACAAGFRSRPAHDRRSTD